MKHHITLLLILLACHPFIAWAQAPQPASEKQLWVSGKDKLPYRLLPPAHVAAGKKYPLLVYLHGAGSRGNDNEQPLKKLPAALTDSSNRAQYPCYVLVPQCAANSAWVWFPGFPNSLAATDTPSTAGRLTLELIRTLTKTKNIDADQVYLTGYSLGGEGTFDLLSREPGMFACGVPLASVADTSRAELIKDVPVWAFHGSEDQVNEVKYVRMMIEALKRHGGKPKYTELQGVNHNCQREAYGAEELWQWMFAQKRKPR